MCSAVVLVGSVLAENQRGAESPSRLGSQVEAWVLHANTTPALGIAYRLAEQVLGSQRARASGTSLWASGTSSLEGSCQRHPAHDDVFQTTE